MQDIEIERLIGGAPRIELEDIVKHPRLVDARKLYLDRFLEVYGGDPFLVRLLIESGRFLVYTSRPCSRPGTTPHGAKPGSPSAS